MSELFNEPDACWYEIRVIWPDGQVTTESGIRLTAEQVADALAQIAHDIRQATQEAGQ